MRKFFLLLFLFCLALPGYGQELTVRKRSDYEKMLAEKFLGKCVSISNVSYQGSPVSVGTFSGGGSLGISDGIVLSTGAIEDIPGKGSEPMTEGNLRMPGDDDLNKIVRVQDPEGYTRDAAVLEFDFVSSSSKIEFDYMFASEEYPQFVNQRNDVFAFFLSKPGVSGRKNIALLPNTNTPVSINTVNANTNSQFFRLDQGHASQVRMNGATVVMQAKADIVPGETYHIKIALADARDSIWDSAVFLSASSLSGVEEISGSADRSIADECSQVTLTFQLDYTHSKPTDVKLQFQGSATPGVDYSVPGTTIRFEPNQLTTTLTLDILPDNSTEGSEQILVSIAPENDCFVLRENTLGIVLQDNISGIVSAAFVRKTVEECEYDTLVFQLEQAPSTSLDLDLRYTGTAGLITDYAPLPIKIRFEAGETVKKVPVEIYADALNEGPETIRVSVLSSGSCIMLKDDNVILTINDFVAPVISASFSQPAGRECEIDTVIFELDRPSQTPLELDLKYSGTAVQGPDFGWLPARIGFAPGETLKKLPFEIFPDQLNEVSETLTISITPLSSCFALKNSSVSMTIGDVRPLAKVSADRDIVEECSSFTITFELDEPRSADYILPLSFQGSSAQAGINYTGIPAGIVFPAGKTKLTITVDALNDDAAGDRVLEIKAGSGSGGCSFFEKDLRVVIRDRAPQSHGRISFAGPDRLCPCGEGTVTLRAPEGTGYLWSNSETTQSITVSSPGMYSVKVNPADPCLSFRDSVLVGTYAFSSLVQIEAMELPTGETRPLRLKYTGGELFANCGIDDYMLKLRYARNAIYPLAGSEEKIPGSDDVLLTVTGKRNPSADFIEIPVMAMFGAEGETELSLDSFSWEECDTAGVEKRGAKLALGLDCFESRARLSNAMGSLLLAAGREHIAFETPESGMTRLFYVNSIGRKVLELVARDLAPGSYTVPVNAADLPGGLYMLILQTPNLIRSEKILISK